MSCSVSIPQAAHSSRSSGRSAARAAGRVDELVLAALPYCASSSLSSSWSTPLGSRWSRRAPVALLPVADDVGVERDAPRRAALEEAERQIGEAAGHAAHEQRLGERVLALGEVTEVVVHVVRDRRAAPPPDGAGVERHADAELLALRPHRVVVVRAVDAVHVDPLRVLRELGITVGDRGDGTLHVAREQHRLEAELAHGVLEVGDRLVGGVHRDGRYRHHAVAELGERVGVGAVQRAARAAPLLLVDVVHEDEPEARVRDAHVDPELVEPLVHELRAQRGREVARVACRRSPPRGPRGALRRPLGR